MVDFIGVGAQKAGTSWIYACLFEHPEICAPVKELHFFSRPRYETEGSEWYERHFAACPSATKVGEFSTSYLYSEAAVARIATDYPHAKLIAVVRHPLERAYSQYRNAIKGGEVTKTRTFAEYAKGEPSCLAQGRYGEQLARYFEHFTKEQLLVLRYEDSATDPLGFIQSIYAHLGVDVGYVPPSLESRINVARVPRATGIDRVMHRVAEWLRRIGFSQAVHLVKRSGITDAIRRINTDAAATPEKPDLSAYAEYFSDDLATLSELLGTDMRVYWNL